MLGDIVVMVVVVVNVDACWSSSTLSTCFRVAVGLDFFLNMGRGGRRRGVGGVGIVGQVSRRCLEMVI